MKNERQTIPKSRYDSVDLYLSNDWINRPEYNDTYVPTDEGIYQRLRDHGKYMDPNAFFGILTKHIGLDHLLSRHISHLFVRDPIVIFSETIDQDDSASSDHWEVSRHDLVL